MVRLSQRVAVVTSSTPLPSLEIQIAWLFILPLAIACVSWTVTHEEIFREVREYCQVRSRTGRTVLTRKCFYVLTCEYCFSHYVTLAFLLGTGYRLLVADWRGAVIGFFALAGVANAYMSAYGRLRVDIKAERIDIEVKETEIARRRGDLQKVSR